MTGRAPTPERRGSRSRGVRALAAAFVAALVLALPARVSAQIAVRGATSGAAASLGASYVASGTGTTGSSGATSIALATPSGAAVNDVLLAQVTLKGVVATITAPTGWTLIDRSNSTTSGDQLTQAVYWHVVAAADPSSYTWSWSGSRRGTGGIGAYRNVDVSSPVDAFAVRIDEATTSLTVPAVATAAADAMLVGLLASSASSSHTPPTGMTERYDTATGAGPNGVTASIASLVQASAGSGTARAATGPSTDHVTHGVALRNATGVTLAVPAGTSVNDVMIASLAAAPCSSGPATCTTTILAPSGWTLLKTQSATSGSGSASGVGSQLWVYQRIAGAAEPASYTWAFGGALVQGDGVGGLVGFSGVDATNPVVTQAAQATASATSHAAPSLDVGSVANTMLVSSHMANAATAWTPPAGMSERVDIASRTVPDPLGVALEMATQTSAASGTIAARTATFTAPAPAADTGVAHLLALRPATSGIDHYELWLPSASLACLPTTVTVKACADASSPCTQPYTAASGSKVGLSSSAGTLADTQPALDAAGTASTTLSHAGAADGDVVSVTLGSEAVAATSARKACPNGTGCSVANSASTTFRTAGFIVAATAGGNEATIGTQVAGTASGTFYLRAVKSATTGAACEAALTGTTAVDLAYRCSDPSTCSAATLLKVSGTSAGKNDSGAVSTYAPVSMTFDSNGNAPFSVTYADVGQVSLWARKTVNGALLSGSSNAYVTKPAGFVVSTIRQTAAPQATNPAAADASGARFVKAGEAFGATVTAVTSGGVATPNFGRESTAEGVLLTSTLVAPAGGAAGTLANATIAGSRFSAGIASVTDLAWSEVGIITLTPSVGDGSYLGTGDATGAASASIGRFVPDRFVLSAASVVNRSAAAPACSPAATFTYLDEPFRLVATLTAKSVAGTTTANYAGAFAKFDPTQAAAWNLRGIAGSTVFAVSTSRVALGAATGSWSAGVAGGLTLTASALRAAAPDGPHAIAFGIAPVDADGVGVQPLSLATTPPAAADRATVGSVDARYGRLRVSNAFGSEKAALALPVLAQYWSGSAWVPNAADSCTAIPAAALARSVYLDARGAATTAWTTSAGAIAIAGGSGTLTLAAPTPASTGSVDIAINLGAAAADQSCLAAHPATTGAALPWLRAQQGACASTWDRDPAARATFGIYAPETRKTLHVREVF